MHLCRFNKEPPSALEESSSGSDSDVLPQSELIGISSKNAFKTSTQEISCFFFYSTSAYHGALLWNTLLYERCSQGRKNFQASLPSVTQAKIRILPQTRLFIVFRM